MGKFILFSGAAVLILVCAMVWAPNAAAYNQWDDGCVDCHGDFRAESYTSNTAQDGVAWPDAPPGGGTTGALHVGHQNMVSDNCSACHPASGFNNPPLGGPSGDGFNSCVGCHGREEDLNTSPTGAENRGAGLRQHHEITGAASCGGCHGDNDPANFTPVGEDVPGARNAALGVDPCNDTVFGDFGSDNDGDDLYDENDPDCAVNEPPVADPNGPYTGVVGVAVMFDGTGSFDPDGTITSYDWDFGDGMTGTGPQPQYTYAAQGTYTVTLTVTDDAGATDTATTTATIDPANQAPTADPNGPYTGTVGVPVAFDGSGSFDPDGSIVAYDWDFGDGTTGTGVNPTHTYASDGTFTVTLTVTDDAGATDSATTTATIGVGNQPPVADPNGPYTGTVGVAVSYDGSGSFDPDGTIVAYDWDFGDGMTGTGVNPSHTYAAAGTYNVTLTVTDDAGATDSAGTTATIDPVGIIEVEIEVPGAINANNNGKTPIHIEFTDSNGDTKVEIAELYCGGDVSDAGAMPWKINVEDDEENEFVALFITRDLELVCEDTMMICVGILADGTAFAGMDDLRVVRDADGRCGRSWNDGKVRRQP